MLIKTHSHRTLFRIGVIAIQLLLFGCGDPPTSEKNTELVAPLGHKVVIAEPIAYQPTPDNKLGISENGKGLKLGAHVSEVSINDIHGGIFQIAQAWKNQPALVVFYRGGWCPYCNMQIRELSTRYDEITEAGVQAILISVDTPDKSALLGAKYDIPFPVLSDPELVAHKAFNVVLTLNAETLEKYQEYGINPQQWSGQGHNSIAVASVFLVDSKGHVLFSHAPKDYTQRLSVDQLLEIIHTNIN